MLSYILHQGGLLEIQTTSLVLSNEINITFFYFYLIVRSEQILTLHTQSSLSYLEKDVGLQPRDADRL
mgnify:CR=1 FL=1